MEVILSHENMDFDALASMAAASALYPNAVMVLSGRQSEQVKQYLAIYRDHFPFIPEEDAPWDDVNHIIVTDTPSLERTPGAFLEEDDILVTVFDHHTLSEEEKRRHSTYYLDNTGACITILLEEWIKREWVPSESEITLFALGLYTDTGSFSYPGTTLRDLKAGVFLMEHGLDLELVQQFSENTLSARQQEVFRKYLDSCEHIGGKGLDVITSMIETEHYAGSLNVITSRLMETTGADAVVTVTAMKNKVFIIGRSASTRISLLPVMQHFGGGGHNRAASASVKDGDPADILKTVNKLLLQSISSPITAETIMSAPVKTITEDVRVDEAKKRLIYYGHNGFPVVNTKDKLIGIISRRDIDKAVQHNLGHAPVKGYMSTDCITVSQTASFEEIQNIFIRHNIGRVPVMNNGKILGIVSRTDVIEQLQQQSFDKSYEKVNVKTQIETLLSTDVVQLLKTVGETAAADHMNAFIIGGMVRDILLGQKGEDIDIVVEGNGMSLAEKTANRFDGTVAVHETFGTATVTLPSGRRVDFTTSRTEYYETPAALPTVSRSNIKEDLYRRDFTMNAMAASLHPSHFGDLIDYFHGREDMNQKKLRVLHNLSFVEDPTRILRGIRFEQRFQFRMSKETTAFIHYSVSAVSSLSRTRITAEFQTLLKEADPVQSLSRLDELGVLPIFFPGAAWTRQTKDVLQLYLHSPEQPGDLPEWFCILFCLYLTHTDTVKSAEAAAVTKKQKSVVENTSYLFYLLDEKEWISLGNFHFHASRVSDEALFFASIATDQKQAGFLLQYRKKRSELKPLLNGHDLKAAGLAPGPDFRDYLFSLEQKMLDKEITTRDEALRYIRQQE
ncbi:CBS domain-containing protein [Salibacterium qingdaonense]|uniref:tRNA nucleotidyltransferase (CCA-adding enzyme) n=1 Tax=Salibacterium qingdaonense TaxID=266892 RepID=A0A1I4IHU8_9BACI|nr:CBS domain-containing protein [Salibacterium qingdaonense]SFL53888.1 tRNA nucleotidyltransferase (CCA-adding enzyme) [Salibacterium qingdaonense]